MTTSNPWVTAANRPLPGHNGRGVLDRSKTVEPARGELVPGNWDRWVAAANRRDVPPSTGPVRPQPHVPAPDQALPVVRVTGRAAVWVVGAHGGSAESSIASLADAWVATGHSWPVDADAGSCACVVTARTNVRGLLAARAALTQWAGSDVGPSAHVLGLVLVADAPGKLPAPLLDLAKVVAGGAPRVWRIPWVPAWRLDDPTTDRLPRSVISFVSELRSLTAPATVDAATIRKEGS